jgi:hypothetical protein
MPGCHGNVQMLGSRCHAPSRIYNLSLVGPLPVLERLLVLLLLPTYGSHLDIHTSAEYPALEDRVTPTTARLPSPPRGQTRGHSPVI